MKSSFAVAVLGLALAGFAQEQHQHPQPGTQTQRPQARAGETGQQMPEMCRQMMARHEKMMAEMKEAQARLDQKVSAMNAATGNAKVDAMAAVINELVSQRKQMHSMMPQMPQDMMAHMGSHMQRGGAQSMSQCPMMRRSPQQ